MTKRRTVTSCLMSLLDVPVWVVEMVFVETVVILFLLGILNRYHSFI